MQDKTVKNLFDGYAMDFDSIYGQNRNGLQRFVDRWLRRSMALRLQMTLYGCDPVEDKRVLDVGCGPGRYSVLLALRGAKAVVGVDFSPSMLELARRYAEERGVADRCRFLESDILNFTDAEPYDYTIAMGVMDYIPAPEPFLKHLINMTCGTLFLSFPVAGGILELQRRLRYRWFSHCKLFFYDEEKLKCLFAAINLRHYHIQKIARDFFVEIRIQ